MTSAVAFGAASGTVGALDLSTLDVEQLAAAIRKAESMRGRSKEAVDLLASVKQVKKLRAALASVALASGLWTAVSQVLDETKLMPVAKCCEREIALVQDEVDNRTMITNLGRALEEGSPAGVVGAIDVSTLQLSGLDRYGRGDKRAAVAVWMRVSVCMCCGVL